MDHSVNILMYASVENSNLNLMTFLQTGCLFFKEEKSFPSLILVGKHESHLTLKPSQNRLFLFLDGCSFAALFKGWFGSIAELYILCDYFQLLQMFYSKWWSIQGGKKVTHFTSAIYNLEMRKVTRPTSILS